MVLWMAVAQWVHRGRRNNVGVMRIGHGEDLLVEGTAMSYK